MLMRGEYPTKYVDDYSFAGQMVFAVSPKEKTKTTFRMMPIYCFPKL